MTAAVEQAGDAGAGDSDKPFRILTLDGGGAKGFYTLGVLQQIETQIAGGRPLCESFDLIYGTSTGAIIAALLSLGLSVREVHALYSAHVPPLMGLKTRGERSSQLQKLAGEIFIDKGFADFKTMTGIVAVRWINERPMIFKSHKQQTAGAIEFMPGFGVKIAEAVVASSSAFPFFDRITVTTGMGHDVELIDGGYCANNPTLFAIADAVGPLQKRRDQIRVVSIGVGIYSAPRRFKMWLAGKLLSVQLLQKTLEMNSNSMDGLRQILFSDIPTVRISDTFALPDLATDLLERDPVKLNLLHQQGVESFAKHADGLRRLGL